MSQTDKILEKFERGELVEVTESIRNDVWVERIFICEIQGSTWPFVCVYPQDEHIFRRNEFPNAKKKTFRVVGHFKIRKIAPKKTVLIGGKIYLEEDIEKLGKKIKKRRANSKRRQTERRGKSKT